MTPSSPRVKARITGAIYLAYFLLAVTSGVLTRGILVSGDAAATANNILAHRAQLQAGSAVGLISTALYIVMAALFYDLFKPVHKTISLLAAALALVGCAVQSIGILFQLLPITLLGESSYLGAFTPDQLHALALLSFKLQTQASGIALVFFGLYDLSLGYLIVRSTFLPRALGVLLSLAGLGWLAFLDPSFAGHLSPFIQVLGFLAEVALMLWLITRGVDPERWTEQDNAA